VSTVRKFLTVAVLGASLAFTANAAFASDKVDYRLTFQPTQNVAIVDRTQSVQSLVAGVAAPMSVWSELRYENFGR
jgi:hypothetical protein